MTGPLTRVLLMVALASVSLQAPADSRRFAADDPRWRAECGSCHAAFPPALLTAPAWRQVMGALDRHYGADASVDAKTAAEIGAFLERNAGERGRAAPPIIASTRADIARARALPRITDSAWFSKEHREVPASTIARPDVGSLANCAACHTAADRGDFSERALRVPR